MKSVKKVPVRSTMVCCAVFLFSILYPNVGLANVYNVTNTADGNGVTQLRGAILAADSAGPGPHTINVAAGTYTLTLGQITFGNNPQNISIIGAGPASTIINMTGGAGRDRMFLINPTGTVNNVFTTITGIKFTNGYLTSDTSGGGAIYAGGQGNQGLTVNDCVFDNNICPSSIPTAGSGGIGGAINMFDGTLNVDSCTFTNNKSIDGDAGAIMYQLYNLSALDDGVVNITNSTFSGNTANKNGGAIEFTSQGAAPVGQTLSVNISKNTFLNNTAGGYGGAITANNSGNFPAPTINFNRFIGNVSSLDATTSGLLFVNSAGSVNAENNWWGCNTGPTASPCQQASGVGASGGGSLDANPWLQLRVTASPNPICNLVATSLGNTSTVTASFLTNSDGTAIPVASLSRLIGLPVTWTSTLGTLGAPQNLTIQATGNAINTFTSNGTAGNATVNAQVDNIPVGETSPARANITVNSTTIALTSAASTNAQTVPLNTAIANITYATTGATGATFSGLPPGVSGNWAANVATISGTPTTTAGSPFNYTVTPTGGCGGVTANGSITVNKGNTSASITSQALATTLVGQSFSVSFNAAPSNTSNSPTAMTGNVIVSDGVESCSGAINGSGNGSCSITLNTTGARTLTATYQGDGNFNGSAASPGLGHSVTNTATWTGTSSTNWSTAGNWNTQLAPGSSNDADIPAGAVPFEPTIGAFAVNVTNLTIGSGHTLTVNGGGSLTSTGTATINGNFGGSGGAFSFNNLTIGNAGGVTLGGNATVNGVLALTSGDLNIGANTLTQPPTPASTGTFDVVGAVKRSNGASPLPASTVLTFGNPNNQLTFTGGTQPNDVTMVMAKTAPASFSTAVQRNYTITPGSVTVFTATLRLHYLDGELNGNTPESSLSLRRFTGSGWAPYPATTPVDTTNNWVENNAVQTFSQWAFSKLSPTASMGEVAGRIVDNNGAPVEGAVVKLAGTQNRKFITDANGFYRFENVETGGFYTVTPSRVNYTFNPSVRSFSQLGETTAAAFGATATGQVANPLDTPEYFVRQHYLDFLGREPDEAGFNFWSDQIIECADDSVCIERRRENVSAAYFLSIEFQQTGGLVDGMYRASYGRQSQYAEFIPDTRAVGQGVVVGHEGWQTLLAANKTAFVNAFVNRPAFHAMYDGMDNTLFVNTLIGHTGVTFTAAEREALVSGLADGTQTRADVLRSIAESNSFVNAKFNEAFVMMEYFGYLRRDADPSGYAFWLNKLSEFNGNFERAEMVKAFIVSGEYRARFPR